MQQPPDPKLRKAIANELSKGPPSRAPASNPSARPSPRAPIPMPTASKATGASSPAVKSKRMTVVGIAPPAAGSAAAPPSVVRTASSISPLAQTMDKKVGPTTTNPTSGPPKAGGPPPLSAKPEKTPNEADEDDASITATAPAPRVGAAAAASTGAVVKPPPLPLTVPGPVQIREMPPPEEDEESQDETEVRTLIASPDEPPKSRPPKSAAPAPAPAAGAPAPAPAAAAGEEDSEEIEDSVTTQAPSAVKGVRLPEEDEPKTSPPVMSPVRTSGKSPFDQPPIRSAAAAREPAPDSGNDAYSIEDSVTTRGLAIGELQLAASQAAGPDGPESSGQWPSPVTPISGRPATMSQAIGLPPKKLRRDAAMRMGLPPALEDSTEGTSNKKGAPLPKVGGAAVEDEEGAPEENRTAVMIGAPVNYAPGNPRAARPQLSGGMGSHASGAAARAQAPADKRSSESGLRIAPEHHPAPQDERASLGAMMAGALHANHDRGSGVAPREYPSHPLPPLQPHQVPHHYPASEPNLALGATLPVSSPLLQQQLGPMSQMPQMQHYDFASTIKKPRYGLLVGLVALLSFAIPLVLFLWLHQNAQEPYMRAPSEVASDKQGFAPPPGKSLAPPPPVPDKKRPGGRR